MKLGSKTFLYSAVIALMMGIVIFSYMIFLMPAMYMDYKEKQNLETAKASMELFKKKKSLMNLETGESSVFGIIVKDRGYDFKLTGVGFDGKVRLVNPSMKKLLDKVRTLDKKDAEKGEMIFRDFKPLLSSIAADNKDAIEKNLKIEMDAKKTTSRFEAEKQRLHYFDRGTVMGEFTVKNKYSGASYTSFVGFSKQGNSTLIMVSNVITPTAKEILPVLYGSAPMLILLMVLFAFGVSAIYSKKIVEPIKKLSMDAEKRMYSAGEGLPPLEVSGKDEIADLTAALNLLYEKQSEAVSELEEENKRKEVYMRATSHQLKTPIAASMLLVDGMMANVGKFKDRNTYLPEVKYQLREMMNIVEETSTINGISDGYEVERVDLENICREIIGKNRIAADSKGIDLQLEMPEKKIYWQSNFAMLKKILENLISNGINHTKDKGSVRIIAEKTKIKVLNRPAHIEEEIIEDMFEPFVTRIEGESLEDGKGHGLGLYIAKYFAGKLNLELRGENLQGSVQFILEKRGRDD